MLNFDTTIARLKSNGMLESREKIQEVIDALTDEVGYIRGFVQKAMSEDCEVTISLAARGGREDCSFEIKPHHKDDAIEFAIECGKEYTQLVEHLKTLAPANPSGCSQIPRQAAP